MKLNLKKIRNKILFFFALVSLFSLTIGQYKNDYFSEGKGLAFDTILVYDTVFVHDTIRISDYLINHDENFLYEKMEIKSTVLQIDTGRLSGQIILFSENSAATLPINHIIINDNINNKQKMNNMKRIGFFGLVFLAFQSTVLPQTNYGLTGGIGTWWATSNKSYIKSVFSPTFQVGFFVDKRLANSNFSLKSGLNYYFLMSNYSYKSILDSGQMDTWGDGESASNYHQISIPLCLGYTIGKFQPYAGVEYAFRLSDAWLGKKINYFGIDAGVSYTASKKVNFSLNYSLGLTNDYNVNINQKDPLTSQPTGIIKTFNWKSSRIGLSVSYNLGQNTKNE